MNPSLAAESEPHQVEDEEMLREVHSFSFWFQAVEGYLTDRPFGADPDLVDEPMDSSELDNLITTLCNYCEGEAAALEASSGLIALAPNNAARIFLATQVADEARHLEVFLRRLDDLGVVDPEAEVAQRANPHIVEFHDKLTSLVAREDFEGAVFAQNVLLESLEDTVFRFHEQIADPITKQVLQGVVADERRHLGFGENEMGRRLARDPSGRERLVEIRSELDPLVLSSFQGIFRDLGLSKAEEPSLGQDYLAAVERLGLT